MLDDEIETSDHHMCALVHIIKQTSSYAKARSEFDSRLQALDFDRMSSRSIDHILVEDAKREVEAPERFSFQKL
jgi:hypothetical protein